jgi:hypothetical protein
MAWVANTTPRDDAADAARFLTRLAYAVLAVGAPVGLLLHPVAIYLLFPVGVALLTFAAALDPSAIARGRWKRASRSPLTLLALALLAWAALSIVWTPFRVEAWQQSLRYLGLGVAVGCALCFTRPHARATEIYLFAAGVVLSMATVFAFWIAKKHGVLFDYDRTGAGALLIATLVYPAMAGLVARGHPGYARALLVLAMVFFYAINAPGVMIAFLAGFAVLAFAFTGPARTAQEMSWIAAAAIGLAPLFILAAQPLLRLVLNAKLPALPPPYPSIAYAFTVVTRDGARLITGHGFQTVTHGALVGALPPQTPPVALFQVWYELGIVGAWLLAAIAFLAFRAIGRLPPRISPYLSAGFATVIALGVTHASLDDWTWLMMLGLAIVASDAASRSYYLTKRPSAETLANF